MDHQQLIQMLPIVFVILFLSWYIPFYFKRRRLYALADKIPGPPTFPLIGNALKCLMPTTDMADAILSISKYYPSPTKLWLGPYLLIYVYKPEDAKTVLNSAFSLEKPPLYNKLLTHLTGIGLPTLPLEEWKRHRKIIHPIFNTKTLRSFFDTFYRQSENLVDALKVHEGKGAFDVQSYLIECTMNNILETLLDLNVENNGLKNPHQIEKWFKVIFSTLILRTSNILYSFDFIFNKSAAGKTLLKVKEEYGQYIELLIEKWQVDSRNKNIDDEVGTEGTGLVKPKNFIEHLLSISDENAKFTLDELKGEVNTILAGGVETSSSLMGFVLIILGIHQEVQEKLYQEILTVLGERKQLEYEDLNKLEYMGRVLKETLRIFPGQAALARYTDQEIQLESCTIPANTPVLIGIFGLHRDPNIWPNPTKFDPDRFLPEEEAKRHPYSWIPFSGGPRNCIGNKFAEIASKIMLANLILNYRIGTIFKNIEDVHLTMILVFHPTRGFQISISKRHEK